MARKSGDEDSMTTRLQQRDGAGGKWANVVHSPSGFMYTSIRTWHPVCVGCKRREEFRRAWRLLAWSVGQLLVLHMEQDTVVRVEGSTLHLRHHATFKKRCLEGTARPKLQM